MTRVNNMHTQRDHHHWSEAEDALIRETYHRPGKVVATHIGCSLKAVYNRRTYLRRIDNEQRFVHVITERNGEVVGRSRAVLTPNRITMLTDKEQRDALKHFELFLPAYTTPKPTLMQRIRAFFNI